MPHSQTTDAERWEAVTARAPAPGGGFFYAVRTTAVFCRPGCASRRPRRENVEFFDTGEEAVRAGYRACKRCAPLDPNARDALSDSIREACRLLASEDGAQNRDVAAAIGLSDSYFQRAFKKRFGITPQQYRRRILAERARDCIGGSDSVTQTIYEAGYSSSSRFYEGVGRELGMNPSAAKAGGADERIQYALLNCTLGQALVAWTERGVCEVAFAGTREGLRRQLEKHFPKARLEKAERSAWAEAVISSVEASSPIDVPLDIRGTVFQERVWRELRKIPIGETRSYSELAKSLGEPSAARAVARACASNLLAVLIPCHRVIRKDGDLSGYRWGLERKRELLRREASSRKADPRSSST